MPRSEAIFSSFFLRVVNIWNCLPGEIKSMDMDEEEFNKEFKKAVNEHYMKKFENNYSVDSLCTWVSKCRCFDCRI